MKLNRKSLRRLIFEEVRRALLESTFEGDNIEEGIQYAVNLAGNNQYIGVIGTPETDDVSIDPNLITVTVCKPGSVVGDTSEFIKFRTKEEAEIVLSEIRAKDHSLFRKPQVSGGIQKGGSIQEGDYFYIEFFVNWNA